MLDISKIRSDISQLIADCIHLKSLLRATWVRPMAEEQQRLLRVRRRLTELFVLLAFSRKKLHVRKAPRDWSGEWDAAAYHETITMRLRPDYSLEVSASEVRT
ncbi:MAG: hypothetical protein U0270_10580 [Labilithrix sp.]